MHTPSLKLMAVALMSAGFGLTAVAQTSPSPGSSPSGATAPGATGTTGAAGSRAAGGDRSVARADRKFMETAAQHGMAEVELGKLAAQKAQSPEVKQFGERMVQDHTKANQQLMQLAQSKGVELPKEPDAKHKRMMERMSKLEPARFDREYMEQMVDDHKQDISEFREAAKDAKDPDVKNFAATSLPVLEEHHKLAQSIQRKVKDMDRSARGSGTSPSTGTGSPGAGAGTGTGPR